MGGREYSRDTEDRESVCVRETDKRSLLSKYLDVRESVLSHHSLGDNAREGNHR